jgi:hypothetical protein
VCSEAPDPTYDQVPLRSLYDGQDSLRPACWTLNALSVMFHRNPVVEIAASERGIKGSLEVYEYANLSRSQDAGFSLDQLVLLVM